jgi:hypothetical protein
MNHKKQRRLYIEERLQVLRRIGRERAAVTRVPLAPAKGPNPRWSMDVLHDALSDGRRFVPLRRGPPCMRYRVGRGQTLWLSLRPDLYLNVSRVWKRAGVGTGRKTRSCGSWWRA